jgi:hypothetical protein
VEARNASLDLGGAVNNNIGGKPPAAPGRFDKAHVAAFARMESIATTGAGEGGLKWKASAGDEGLGERARVEGAADVDSNINTSTSTNPDPNTNTNSADAVKDTAQKDKDEERRQLEANRTRRRSTVGGGAGGVRGRCSSEDGRGTVVV